jgi:predicted nucleic acid-binding protein
LGALFLDTTVMIDLLRGLPRTAERLRRVRDQRETLYTCAVNIEEVMRGLRAAEAPAAQALFEALHIAPLGRSEGILAGNWRRDYARRGRTLSQADCLIAATALGVTARLATGNPKDFPMRELVVDVWPVG